jgi:hypothetical protein
LRRLLVHDDHQMPARGDPPAVLYRGLEGKENTNLDFATEKEVFLLLGEHRIADLCLHYDDVCRFEEFYDRRTLTPVEPSREWCELSDPIVSSVRRRI